MKKNHCHKKYALTALLLLFLFVFPSPSDAFYNWEKNDSYVELSGMARIFGSIYINQNNDLFFPERKKAGLAGLIRIMADARINDSLVFELNIYQTYIPFKLTNKHSNIGMSFDVERSSLPEHNFSNSNYAHLALDRLNMRWSDKWFDIIIGRQAINQATTFFFSPNDFFAPFAAQAFYRLYKPGVDAIKAEINTGDLSQLSLIYVMGYDKDMFSETGWNKNPLWDRNSYLARVTTVFKNFEWALIAGSIKGDYTFGASLQGEIFNHFGLRAEGNISQPDKISGNSVSEFSIGIDRHFNNSLDLRLEHFYNGKGTSNESNYETLVATYGQEISYLGKNYTALGLGYEFTPLLKGDVSFIANIGDHSMLGSIYAVYSLANETDLSVNIGIPFGKSPKGMDIRSEFGMSPYTLNIEIRHFF